MTKEELKKIPFHMVSHLSLENEHRTTYSDDSGRLGFCDITPKKEFDFGKSRRVFRLDSKWYDDKAEFEKALEGIPAWTFHKKKGGEQC